MKYQSNVLIVHLVEWTAKEKSASLARTREYSPLTCSKTWYPVSPPSPLRPRNHVPTLPSVELVWQTSQPLYNESSVSIHGKREIITRLRCNRSQLRSSCVGAESRNEIKSNIALHTHTNSTVNQLGRLKKLMQTSLHEFSECGPDLRYRVMRILLDDPNAQGGGEQDQGCLAYAECENMQP